MASASAAAVRAKALSRDGHAANAAQDFAKARRLFEEAYRVMPADDVEKAKDRAVCLFSAANMCVKMGEQQEQTKKQSLRSETTRAPENLRACCDNALGPATIETCRPQKRRRSEKHRFAPR